MKHAMKNLLPPTNPTATAPRSLTDPTALRLVRQPTNDTAWWQPTYKTYRNGMPKLPEEAIQGIFREYQNWVSPTTEAPREFHFAALAAFLSALLGRLAWFFYGRKTFANLYICCAGQSGLTRKTTTISRLIDLSERGAFDFKIMPGIAHSGEAFLDAFSGDSSADHVLLWTVNEMTHLLRKAARPDNQLLLDAVIQMFDCPSHAKYPTRSNPISLDNVCCCILAMTTLSGIRDELKDTHVESGFANRWAYFLGQSGHPIPFPPPPDETSGNHILAHLRAIHEFVAGGREFRPTVEARELWTDYYTDTLYPLVNDDSRRALLWQRNADYAWKFSLLFAADDLTDRITDDHLRRGILVGEYLRRTASLISGEVAADRDTQVEQKVLSWIDQKADVVSMREVHQKIGGRISADRLKRIVEGLVAMGAIARTEDGHLFRTRSAEDCVDGVDGC